MRTVYPQMSGVYLPVSYTHLDVYKRQGKTRMRPILMTTLTTVLAMSTMVFSTDAAAEMSRGMAIVEIGG